MCARKKSSRGDALPPRPLDVGQCTEAADSTVNPPERWVYVCTTRGVERYSAMQHQLQASYSEILSDIVFIVFFIK